MDTTKSRHSFGAGAARDTLRRDLKVEWVELSRLTLNSRNPRTHSRKQVRQIADSIRTFGWTCPVLVDRRNSVVAGHGRLAAATLLELNQVPTIRIDDLDEARLRAYALADNRIAELAGWDDELLATEIRELEALDLDFEIGIIGFETAEIDILLDGIRESGAADPDDELPDLETDEPPVSQNGDLWLLGPHRLLCGDATDGRSFERLLGDKKAGMVFIDPPYNVPISGHVSGLGSTQHREFAMASGEMSRAGFTGFLKTVLSNHADFSCGGSIHFVCMDWRHLAEIQTAGEETYDELKNVCVWVKTNAGMGSLYRSQHELVLVFKKGKGQHVNNIDLGRYGRYRTNVWQYAGANSFGPDRDEELAMHPTVKPVALVADAIRDCSERGTIILDGFTGSGTTLIAAEQTDRVGYGIELDPLYVDVAIRRFEALTGKQACLAETGRSFSTVANERMGGNQ